MFSLYNDRVAPVGLQVKVNKVNSRIMVRGGRYVDVDLQRVFLSMKQTNTSTRKKTAPTASDNKSSKTKGR